MNNVTKKDYRNPIVEVRTFFAEDILTASNEDNLGEIPEMWWIGG